MSRGETELDRVAEANDVDADGRVLTLDNEPRPVEDPVNGGPIERAMAS